MAKQTISSKKTTVKVSFGKNSVNTNRCPTCGKYMKKGK